MSVGQLGMMQATHGSSWLSLCSCNAAPNGTSLHTSKPTQRPPPPVLTVPIRCQRILMGKLRRLLVQVLRVLHVRKRQPSSGLQAY